MIEYSLRSYIETVFTVDGGEVVIRKQSDQAMTDLKAIVSNAIWLFDYKFADDFKGFSPNVKNQVDELERWQGSQVDFNTQQDKNIQKGSIGFFAYQQMVLKLKSTALKEATDFLTPHLPYLNRQSGEFRTAPSSPTLPVAKNSVKTASRDTSKGTYIPPISFSLEPVADNNKNLASLKLSDDLFSKHKQKKVAEETPTQTTTMDPALEQFTSKVMQLLEANNKLLQHHDQRLDYMQAEIDSIKNGGNSGNDDLRKEVAQLHDMVASLMNGKRYTAPDGNVTQKARLQPVDLKFDYNSYDLSWEHKAILNEVKVNLLKNRDYKVLITGYADKSGSASYNVKLSQMRALAVQNFLISSGINKNRLIVNYFGDLKSHSVGPSDRKVEIEYLIDFTAQEGN